MMLNLILSYMKQAASSINLSLNHNKSEVICAEESTKIDMLALLLSLSPPNRTHTCDIFGLTYRRHGIHHRCAHVEVQDRATEVTW